MKRWRQGRKVGRTIYNQLGPEPSDSDPLIGVMDTSGLAATVVDAANSITEFRARVEGLAFQRNNLRASLQHIRRESWSPLARREAKRALDSLEAHL